MTDETQTPAPVAGEDTGAVLAALQGDKTYLTDKGDEPIIQAEETPGDDAAAAPEAEPEAPKPKVKQTAQERIDELTAARREAERDRDFYKEQALRAPTAKPAEAAPDPAPQGDGKPDPSAYENGVYDPQYVEDLTDWKVGRALDGRDQQRRQQDQVRTNIENYETRTKTLYPDGKPAGLKAFEQILQIPVSVFEIVGASDVGPKIAEHLGANPDELARLDRLSPILQARELTQLEQRLTEPVKPIPKTATDAPEPAPTARGAGGRFSVAPDTDDFEAFQKQHFPGG